MSHWYQKITKTKFGTIQVKILSQIWPKIDEDGEKCRKSNLDFVPQGKQLMNISQRLSCSLNFWTDGSSTWRWEISVSCFPCGAFHEKTRSDRNRCFKSMCTMVLNMAITYSNVICV